MSRNRHDGEPPASFYYAEEVTVRLETVVDRLERLAANLDERLERLESNSQSSKDDAGE